MTEAPPVTRMKSEKKMKWNEENLKENEVIQATIEKGKITEPKTPYHPPLDDTDVEIPPLDLDMNASNTTGFVKNRKDHYAVPGLKELLATKVDDEEEA